MMDPTSAAPSSNHRRLDDKNDAQIEPAVWKKQSQIRDKNPREKIPDNEEEKLKPSDFLFFAANSTFHGMSHIFTPGRCTLRKVLWGLAFVLSFGLFFYQAYDRYMYYNSRPHVTKLDEKEVEEMIFPAVTICNMNPFRVKKITRDDYYHAGENILEIFDSKYNLRANKFKDNQMWPFVQSKIKNILQQQGDFVPESPTFNIFEFYDRTGHEFQGMVKQCKYRGKNCISQWNTVFTRYGKCYTFNGMQDEEKLMKTLKGGIDNGLEVLLDTEQDNYMPVWAESDEISVEAGFKVQIHAQAEPPFIHELGFGISPGFQRLVATQEQRITFLPKPYGDCESGANKSTHLPYETYSISACRIICETKYVIKKCSCRMVHMPGDARFCSPEEYKKCADKELDMLVQTDENLCVCKTPCDVIRYNLEMSSLRLPSTQALSYLAFKYNKTEEYVKKNFAKLNIFFEALNYETIDQKKAYELAGLLGDIGGQMGLFIGASILTVLELFDYIYEFGKDKIWKRTENRTARKKRKKHVTAAKDSSSRSLEQHDTQFVSGPRTNYLGYNTEFPVFVEGEFDDNQNEDYDYANGHQRSVLPQALNSQAKDNWRNKEVLQNQEPLMFPKEKILRRPVSCSVFPHEIKAAPQDDHASVSGWLSPRPLHKDLPQPSQQPYSPETWLPPREFYYKKSNKTSPFSFTPEQSFSTRETDIN